MFEKLAVESFEQHPRTEKTHSLLRDATHQLAALDAQAKAARGALDRMAHVAKALSVEQTDHVRTLRQTNAKANARLRQLRESLRAATDPDATPRRPAASPPRDRPKPTLAQRYTRRAVLRPFVYGVLPLWGVSVLACVVTAWIVLRA